MRDLLFLLVLSAAPAATIYAVWYGFTAPWWRSTTGWALFVHALSLALLIDISIVNDLIGRYAADQLVAGIVVALIALGEWLMLGALWRERRLARRRRESAPLPPA